ncbi:MAG: DUF4410 domain-containing protein [Akkermansiaceae bacterium]|nr:DUF4410 domain-containing protein [Akkermansiaceae bacterium]
MKFVLLLIAPLFVFLASCGTTTTLQDASGGVAIGNQKFSKVIVRDFGNKSGADSSAQASGQLFAAKIKGEIAKTGRFKSVSGSGKAGADTLIIDGDITRYNEGNASLRMFIGMGAGSSYFDAVSRFSDGSNNKELGRVTTDKNSWALGGGIAATQTVDSFMTGAAKQVAAEAAKLAK